MAAAQDE